MEGKKQIAIYLAVASLFLFGFMLLAPDAEAPDGLDDPAAPGVSVPVVPHQRITSGEARLLMESGEPYILLDVRTEAEFERSHIPGAILFPYTEISQGALAELQDPEARILLYCQTGRRSQSAAEALSALGFTHVYDFGGIADWPYETVNG